MPGIAPLDLADWLRVDECYAAQIGEKARLIAADRGAVLALDGAARPAAHELMGLVVDDLGARAGFTRDGDHMIRPDGGRVRIDMDDPMATLGHLTQEDFCILEKRGDEHVLVAATLCFPASWTLAEKFLNPLIGIHIPVASYDESIAKRVQRLFDGVQPGRPLWRSNLLWYDDPALHQPRTYSSPRVTNTKGAKYLRTEFQTIRRLPETKSVVFGIHTYILSPDRARELGYAPQ